MTYILQVSLSSCQLIGIFKLYFHTLLNTYNVRKSTQVVQWKLYVEICQQPATKSAKKSESPLVLKIALQPGFFTFLSQTLIKILGMSTITLFAYVGSQ